MTRGSATAWDVLSDGDYVAVLERLLTSHPELRRDADDAALAVLADVNRFAVADDVRWAVESVGTADVGARSGRQRGRGYVDPSEAAWELLGAAVEPFVTRVRRLAELGLHVAAIELAAGILLGLNDANGDDDCAIFFEEDFAAEHQTDLLVTVRELGLDTASLEQIATK